MDTTSHNGVMNYDNHVNWTDDQWRRWEEELSNPPPSYDQATKDYTPNTLREKQRGGPRTPLSERRVRNNALPRPLFPESPRHEENIAALTAYRTNPRSPQLFENLKENQPPNDPQAKFGHHTVLSLMYYQGTLDPDTGTTAHLFDKQAAFEIIIKEKLRESCLLETLTDEERTLIHTCVADHFFRCEDFNCKQKTPHEHALEYLNKHTLGRLETIRIDKPDVYADIQLLIERATASAMRNNTHKSSFWGWLGY